MDNVNADFTINTNNQLEAEYSLNSEHFDCSFELYAAGTVWGSISGTLSNQVDLQNALNLKANQSALNTLSSAVNDHINDRQNPHEVTKSQVGLGNVDNTSDLNKPISTATQNALNGKQDTISDISTIRENAQNGNSAYETIQTYGDVVNYNASDFATSAQGSLANSALQPGDNVSELVNNVGYITGINSTDVTTALGYTPYDSSNPSGYITNAALTNYVTTNTAQTISSSKAFSQPLVVADNVGLASGTLLSNNKILQRTTDNTLTLNNVNNKLRFIGSETRPQYNSADLALYSDLPTLADLTTEAQLDAINSGATSTNITQITTNKNDISDINDLIPTQATSLNQLADKNFVNSSIATNTANFIGTFNSVADLEAYSGPLTNNDYAFVVGIDSEGNTIYDRYKYTDATTPPSWIFEYELNNSSFTAAQWDAINSGITSGDVTLIETALQPNDNISVLNNDSGYITGVDWGDIGGTLTTQTDLQTALNLKADLSTLATVATSGNYEDLLNKPAIPTVNDATLTIQKNGTDIATFTANSSTNQTANITVPTDNTELTNGAGYITGITSTNVTTALGYTPYNATNPDGYITSSALSGYATETWVGNQGYLTTVPTATTSSLGLVQPDGVTITIDANGVISGAAQGANTDLSNLSATGEAHFQEPLVSGTNIKTINGSSILGSGNLDTPYRNIGEIVQSTIPLTDAGLHLLDGELLQYGSYKAFIDYIADLYGDGTNIPSYFCTEAQWQSSVTTYGVCGKFVYDSTNNTVRLPKITGNIEGTTDVTALGDLIEQFVRLPNITGNFGSDFRGLSGYANGAFVLNNDNSPDYGVGAGTAYRSRTVNFTASRSSSVYSGNGSNTKIQQQAIKCFVYIVIANTSKTEIQVDIDEIATDLNGKADVDGSNMVSSVKNFDGGWVYSNFTVANGASFSENDVEYNLSSELPNDNYTYEVMFSAYATTGNTSGNRIDIAISGLTGMSAVNIIGINTRTNSSITIYGNCIIPVGTSRKVRVGGLSNPNGTYTLYSRGYRRVGTNS